MYNGNNNNNTTNNTYYQLVYDCMIPICFMHGTSHGVTTAGLSLQPFNSVDVSLETYFCECVENIVQVGWNTDMNATVGLSSFEMPSNDATLYAIYANGQ